MLDVTFNDYIAYREGLKITMKENEFKFYSKQAKRLINKLTFNRLKPPFCKNYSAYIDDIQETLFSLIEAIFEDEQEKIITNSLQKESEKVADWTINYVTVEKKTEEEKKKRYYNIIRLGLSGTGLLYAGGNIKRSCCESRKNNNGRCADNV